MTAEVMSIIQVVFYGVVIVLMLVALRKLERIAALLAEEAKRRNLGLKDSANLATQKDSTTETDEELAAVLAVIAHLLPDKKITSIRMISQ